MAPRPKTALVQARVSQDEMAYLQGLADDLELTLSEAIRAAIARSILRDIEHGERQADEDFQWVARNARTVVATPLDADDAVHVPSLPEAPSAHEQRREAAAS